MSSGGAIEKKVYEQTKFNFWEFVGLKMDGDSRPHLIRFGAAFLLIIGACFAMYVTYGDPEASTKSFYYYLFLCTVPILIAMYIVSPLFTSKLGKIDLFVYGAAAIVVLIGLYYFYANTSKGSISIVSKLATGFIILGIIIGLAILYRVVQRFVNMARGWFGFILQFIFYLPCLFIEFLQWFMDELRVAPNMVVVLFVAEILVVLGYLYLPSLLKYMKRDSAKELVGSTPVFLNKAHTIAKYEDFLLDKSVKEMPEKTDDLIRVNYSVGFWVYVNEQAASAVSDRVIFSYSPPGIYNGKPVVKYSNGALLFQLDANSMDATPVATVPIQNQKWNHIVITYDNGQADIYLNGELKQTEKNVAPTFNPIDIMQVGQADGVYGAIKNVVYYKTPIHLGEIVDIYNIMKYTQ